MISYLKGEEDVIIVTVPQQRIGCALIGEILQEETRSQIRCVHKEKRPTFAPIILIKSPQLHLINDFEKLA